MRPVQRAALLLVPAVLALSSCDIPATGVVEAGGPASGITAITPVYFVQNGTLIAVPRRVPEAGDARMAVEVLLQGPTPQERLKKLTTRLARQPEAARPTPAPTETPTEETVREPTEETVRVTTQSDRVYVELPFFPAELTPLAADQVICTAARAYLITRRDLDSTTVTVTDAEGRSTEGTDERCPDL